MGHFFWLDSLDLGYLLWLKGDFPGAMEQQDGGLQIADFGFWIADLGYEM